MSAPADRETDIRDVPSNIANGTKSIRVLLADDHQAVLDRVVAVLSGEFTIVAAVTDSAEAVAAAARLHPDVLVFDVSMPGLNGFEAATDIRDAGSTAVVVFLTVHDEPAFLQAAWEAGALGYVCKPHVSSDLIPAIRAALDGRRFVSASIASHDA